MSISIYHQKDNFVDEKDVFVDEKDNFVDEKDVFVDEKDVFVDEKDVFVDQKDNFVDEKDVFVDENPAKSKFFNFIAKFRTRDFQEINYPIKRTLLGAEGAEIGRGKRIVI
ncbi:MAG: hypothetical protein V7K32_26935 [Nostoc sp.]|uniref:hypothetical protein n=1 Tax=Nostoc sp. TaxID=1180 RepID=UPI002FF74DD5